MSRMYATRLLQEYIDIPTDIDLVPNFLTNAESLQSGILTVGNGDVGNDSQVTESFPEIYLQAEAMETLSAFARHHQSGIPLP